MLNQIKRNDWDTSMFDAITSVRKSHEAINKDPWAYVTINGFRRSIITTKGWSVQVKWKDGSVSCLPLSLVKLSNSIDLAEYVESNNLTREPVFNWCVKQTLTRRAKIISRFKTRKNKGKVKFGIKVPDTASWRGSRIRLHEWWQALARRNC